MGNVNTAPINEAVFLLERVAPSSLEGMKTKFPEIANELKPGIWAGLKEAQDGELQRRILLAKAAVAEAALSSALSLCETAIQKAATKLKNSRHVRLGGQITSVVGASGVLGALGATETELAVISGGLALLGSLASIGSEYFEAIVDPASGNLNTIYLDLAKARYKLSSLLDSLRIYIDEKAGDSTIEEAVAKANVLCEEVHSKVFQVIESIVGKIVPR